MGGELSDGSYLIIKNITNTFPTDSTLELGNIHQTFLSIVLSHDEESRNPRVYQESGNPRVPTTLELPGNMNRNAYYSAFHEWLHSSVHLDDYPLDDDLVWDFTVQVIDFVFERLDFLHRDVEMCVSADLHHPPIPFENDDQEDYPLMDEEDEDDPMEEDEEYDPIEYVDEEEYDPMEDEEEEYDPVEFVEDNNGDESLIKLRVKALSDLRAVVATEEHRKIGDCLICLDPLFSVIIDEEDEDEKKKKCLFESPCGHYFHGECMSEWLTRSVSCPLCRFDVSSLIEQ